jgi:hypothetical protein
VQDTASHPADALVAPRPPFWRRPDVMVGAIVLAVLLSAALTFDTVRNGYGIQGDEGTYTAAALSVAYDYDLAFDRHDLERYWTYFSQGPDGIFLQRPRGEWRLTDSFPFVRFRVYASPPGDRLYFAKAFIYSVFAAPFVRAFGTNGFLVFNILMLALVAWCGYEFLAARGTSRPAAGALSLAFVGISVVPIYVLWMTPEVFNLSLVFYAYFLWLYKEVAPGPLADTRLTRFLFGRGSDIAAAVLVGIVTFSKPPYAVPIAPLVAWQLWKRRPGRAVVLVVTFLAVTALLAGTNAAISGEWNYQGGDRKYFVYPNMVFTTPAKTFDTVGTSKTTNEIHEAVFEKQAFVERLGLTVVYFLFGRHTGLVPFFFPGALALALWLIRWRDIRLWQVLVAGAALGAEAILVVWMPFTWNGGGGPVGNRYFLGVYPALFFLLPPVQSLLVPVVAWAGGAVFTAQLLLNPYFTKAYPYRNLDHGALKMLPVELTMVRDLPLMLDKITPPPFVHRSLHDPSATPLELYALDQNMYPPEPAGIWVRAGGRTDIVVRTPRPLVNLKVTLSSPIPNHVWLSFDGRSTSVDLKPNVAVEVVIPTDSGVYSIRAYDYLLSVKASDGFVPFITEPGSSDRRYLGALMNLDGTLKP